MKGKWLKLYRELFDKPIWKNSTPEQKTILITILGMVNWSAYDWEWKGEKFHCEPGQKITSIDKIVELSGKGITPQNVRTALKRFEKLGFLTNESTKQGRLITIENWSVYQGGDDEPNKETNRRLTDDQQTPNRRLTPNKNNKKIKKEKEEIRIHNNAFLKAAEESPEEKVLTFSNGERRRYRGGIYMMDEEESKRVMDANHQVFLQAVAEGRLKDPRRM